LWHAAKRLKVSENGIIVAAFVPVFFKASMRAYPGGDPPVFPQTHELRPLVAVRYRELLSLRR
jgi:hypothetical protein